MWSAQKWTSVLAACGLPFAKSSVPTESAVYIGGSAVAHAGRICTA